jgi:hypothetical protein
MGVLSIWDDPWGGLKVVHVRRASYIGEKFYVRIGLKMLLGSKEVLGHERTFPKTNQDKPDSGYPP